MLKEFLTNIANAIRSALGTSDVINAQDFPAKVNEVYEAGKQAEYDAFWDGVQIQWDGTAKTDYRYCFYGWSSKTINPKYPIETSTLMYTFSNCRLLEEAPPITVNSGTLESAYCAFDLCQKLKKVISVLPINGSAHAMFNYCPNLVEVRKIISYETTQWTNKSFATCNELVILEIEGVIASNFFVGDCKKLDYDSLCRIMSCLATDTSGLSVTISKTAVNNAFETSTGAADGMQSSKWTQLVANRANWSIAWTE